MINQEILLSISGLKYKLIEKLDEKKWPGYIRNINTFIDVYPDLEEKIKSDLRNRKYIELRKNLINICGMLNSIYAADSLTVECNNQIVALATGNVFDDRLEVFVENFTQSVASLSIDIQVAASRNGEQTFTRFSKKSKSGEPVILAIDDAEIFLKILQKILADAPYGLKCVTSGQEALNFLSAGNRVDIILLDIAMPDMDGYNTMEKFNEMKINTPVIFVTAYADRKYVNRAIELGAVGLLAKPLRKQQLLNKINEVCSVLG